MQTMYIDQTPNYDLDRKKMSTDFDIKILKFYTVLILFLKELAAEARSNFII